MTASLQAPETTGRDVAILVLLACIVIFPSFATRDLWNPDEPRYMEVAREMVVLGGAAYIVPQLNGELYPEKPPMVFCLGALLYRLGFGHNSMRLLAGLASIGTILLTYALARRMGEPPFPLLAGLITLTTLLFTVHMKIGVIDPVLAFTTTLSLYCGYRALHRQSRRGTLWWLGFYAGVGLGALIKGPVAALVCGGVIITYGLWNRRNVHGGGWMHLPGVLLVLLLAAAWIVPAGIYGSWEYVRSITVGQLQRRVVSATSHRAPFYYYIMQFPLHFFPWCLLFIPALVDAVRRWRRERAHDALFATIWFAGLCIAFSAISGKRQGYILPLVPGFALLTAGHLARGWRGEWLWPKATRHFFTVTFAAGASLFLAGAVAVFAFLAWPAPFVRFAGKYAEAIATARSEVNPWLVGTGIALAVATSGCALLGLWLSRKADRLNPCVITLLVAVVLASLASDLSLAPVMNPMKSGRRFCEEALPYLAQTDETYLFPRDYSGVYNLYTGIVSMPLLEDHTALAAVMGRDRKVAVIGQRHLFETYAPDVLAQYNVLAERRVGYRLMLLVANWTPQRGSDPMPPSPATSQ